MTIVFFYIIVALSVLATLGNVAGICSHRSTPAKRAGATVALLANTAMAIWAISLAHSFAVCTS